MNLMDEKDKTIVQLRVSGDLLATYVEELEAQRDLFVQAIGRVGAGLPLPPPPDGTPAIVTDALEALDRFRAQHAEMTDAEMTEGLDAFNTILGRAAARAGEGRLVELNAEPQPLPAEGRRGELTSLDDGLWLVCCARCPQRLRFRSPSIAEASNRLGSLGWDYRGHSLGSIDATGLDPDGGWLCSLSHTPRPVPMGWSMQSDEAPRQARCEDQGWPRGLLYAETDRAYVVCCARCERTLRIGAASRTEARVTIEGEGWVLVPGSGWACEEHASQ